MKLSFFGAAQDVTGSCFLLECAAKRILVDCGMFQGSREHSAENYDAFGFDPKAIDVLLLTHAHLDHCGRIPLLVKRGFKGEIITTAASRELAKLVMLDAAHLQEEDAERHARRADRHGQTARGPLYTVLDALTALDRFGRAAEYDQPIRISEEISVRFVDAGHILGSASLVIEAREGGQTRRLVFSGDLGSPGRPVLNDPEFPPPADYVVMETTYGDRRHKSREDSVKELYDAVTDTFARGGNVVIPTFALERAQDILFYFHEGVAKGILPRHVQIFLDSPMAISATEIFRKHAACFKPPVRAELESGGDPFSVPRLRFTRHPAESMAINRIEGGAVIMAGSGMCTGGRVRHHLKHNLWRSDCSIVFVGYAAAGTPARQIIDGAHEIKLFGEMTKVRAKIYTINGFSAHAGQDELAAWHDHAGRPRTTFLVHGDEKRGMAGMAKILTQAGHKVMCPALNETVELT